MSVKLERSFIHVPRTMPFTGKTLGQSFNETADNNPDKEMYVFYADKERKTYKEVQNESHKFACSLMKLGLTKGDRIGIWGGNHYEWLLAYAAALQLGLITVHMRMDFPLNVQPKILEKLGIKVLVLMRSPADLFDKACQIIPEILTNDADNLNCQSIPTLKYVVNAGSQKARGAFSLDEFMDIGCDIDHSQVRKACQAVDFDDAFGIFFTSGSTGFPKGVTHTHKNFSRFATTFKDRDGNVIPWDSRYLLIMSFGGAGAQLGALNPMMKPATTIIIGPVYNARIMANAMQDERATGAALLVHHLSDILNMPDIDDFDFSSVQLCMSGGSIIPRSLRDRAAEKITKYIMLAYGGTEGFGAIQTPTDSLEILEAPAYYPDEGSEVKIIGDDEQILPINTPGEICFRNGVLFRGYWDEEEKTKQAKRDTGWYHTGDVGTLDENGYLRLSGRIAERIIKEGINIAPGDLEKVLDQHPAVNNVMVVGVPDKRTSEEVCACVRLHSSVVGKITTDELRDFCKGKVSSFLVPKYVVVVDEPFPITETGKFHRKLITEQARTTLGL